MLSWAPKATRSSRYHFRRWHACVGTAKSPAPTKEKIGKYLIKFMLKEKFAPYWDNKVQNAWVAFLHDMLDNDPTTHIGRQAWRNVSSLLEKLDITGFGSGLTPISFNLSVTCHAPFSNWSGLKWIYTSPMWVDFHPVSPCWPTGHSLKVSTSLPSDWLVGFTLSQPDSLIFVLPIIRLV